MSGDHWPRMVQVTSYHSKAKKKKKKKNENTGSKEMHFIIVQTARHGGGWGTARIQQTD